MLDAHGGAPVGVGDESGVDTLGVVPDGFSSAARGDVVAVPDGTVCAADVASSQSDPPTCPSRTWTRTRPGQATDSLTLAVVSVDNPHLDTTVVLRKGTIDGRPAVVERLAGDSAGDELWVGWTDAAGVRHVLARSSSDGRSLTTQQLLDVARSYTPGR